MENNPYATATSESSDDWEALGNCADLPLEQVDELFFPAKYNGIIPPGVSELCGSCAVQGACLEDALDNPPTHGFRAGFAASDLQKMASGENVVTINKS